MLKIRPVILIFGILVLFNFACTKEGGEDVIVTQSQFFLKGKLDGGKFELRDGAGSFFNYTTKASGQDTSTFVFFRESVFANPSDTLIFRFITTSSDTITGNEEFLKLQTGSFPFGFLDLENIIFEDGVEVIYRTNNTSYYTALGNQDDSYFIINSIVQTTADNIATHRAAFEMDVQLSTKDGSIKHFVIEEGYFRVNQ